MKINFFPESNHLDYIKAALEYEMIWKKNGKKILTLIKKYSGLNFKTKTINALTYGDISYSSPLILESNLPKNIKEGVLVHELLHRLLAENDYYLPNKNFTIEVHRIINLILFDIWEELFGYKKAKNNQKHEIGYGCLDYKKAWNWALSFPKEQRREKFEEMKLKYQKK
jgi:hypothetical protein